MVERYGGHQTTQWSGEVDGCLKVRSFHNYQDEHKKKSFPELDIGRAMEKER